MSIKAVIGLTWARLRYRSIQRIKANALSLQRKTFQHLIRTAKQTAFGQDHQFDQIKTFADFQKRVPVRDYEASRPWMDRIYREKPM
jgi:hypothetical protein